MGNPAIRDGIAAAFVLAACTSQTPRPRGEAESPSSTAAAASAPDRCRELPRLERGPTYAADCPDPLNSDRTQKRLPPAPPSEPGRTFLAYIDDFGPPSMQLGILGQPWWSWEAGGSWEPCDAFDIRVVVHAGPLTDDVRERFPTVRGKSDYRFVERDRILRYLDEKIRELQTSPGGDDWSRLVRELESTKRTIAECLPR